MPTSAQATEPFTSELHYDNTGIDTGEAVEVQAEAGTGPTGWSVVLYNGTGGAAYGTLALIRPDNTVAEFLSYEGAFVAVDGPAGG